MSREAPACRTTFVTSSRTTATTSCTRSGGSSSTSLRMRRSAPQVVRLGHRPDHLADAPSDGHREASSASWSSKIDERMRAIVPSSSSTRSLMRAATSGLRLLERAADPVQGQARGEDPLDDVVVQVAGDAVPVRLDLQALLPLLRPGQLEDDGGLGGERRQEVEVVGGERLAPRGAHHREQPPPGAVCPAARSSPDRSRRSPRRRPASSGRAAAWC